LEACRRDKLVHGDNENKSRDRGSWNSTPAWSQRLCDPAAQAK